MQTMFVFGRDVRTLRFLMNSAPRPLLIAAGLLGFTGVALGAFGAHGLKATLEATGQVHTWEKAVFYQLVHAVALLALANWPDRAIMRIGACWVGGVVLFSGSLYCLALGGPIKILWPVTPLGGLALLAGWLLLTWTAVRQTKA
jgi:uncharacterized membrane protein YgdD (TMEM256/DUF423 family)